MSADKGQFYRGHTVDRLMRALRGPRHIKPHLRRPTLLSLNPPGILFIPKVIPYVAMLLSDREIQNRMPSFAWRR
jgi:hypothetical protein